MEKKPTYEELETRIKYLEEKLEIHNSLGDQSLKGTKQPGLASNVKTNISGINDEYDEFLVRPSEQTIEKEIQDLLVSDNATKADMAVALQNLQNEIKERERAEEDEKKLQSLLLNTIKIAQIGPWEYDPATGLFTFNDYFYKIFRTSAEEVGGYKMSMAHYTERFIPPEVREFTQNEAMKVINSNEPVASNQIEHKIIRADGTLGYINVRSFVVKNAEGEILRIYGVNQDITNRKIAEEKLRESEEKLARAKKMESLGLLAGGVAHDLNNVLSGIVSYPELLLLDLPEDSQLRKPIETIQDSGKKAVAIVQDLLTIARGVATSKETLNLNNIIDEYVLSPEFKKLRQFHPTVQVTTEFDPDLLNITGSVVHIRKVVMNLVSNAAEAIESSGNITISTRNCYIDKPIRKYEDVKTGEYAVFSISDDGLGISPEYIDRIFEPFFTKKVMGMSGTGLGLTVVWNILQDHAGYIDVESNEKGTKFELYFPTTRNEVEEKNLAQSLKEIKGNGENILIVDDEENQREITCSMLNVLGYNTVAVSSGEMAIEYLKENKADLILLDMIMEPGINGRETYERILKFHPFQRAIIVSGFAETDEVKKAQSLGAGQYLRKPLTLEKIGAAIKRELKQS